MKDGGRDTYEKVDNKVIEGLVRSSLFDEFEEVINKIVVKYA